MTRILPAVPELREHEDIAAFVHRVAEANFTTVKRLTGHDHRAVVWENPGLELLNRVSQLTGYPTERLHEATLVHAYPAASLTRARTGRRWSLQPAQCPGCQVRTVGARLSVIVLCPRCAIPLEDAATPVDAPAPHDATAAVQHEMTQLLQDPTASETRFTRLESLILRLEPALWSNWPALLPGESQTSRNLAVGFAKAALHDSNYYARPPGVSATLIGLCWPHTRTVEDANAFYDRCTFMSDSWNPTPEQRRQAPTTQTPFHQRLRSLGVRVEHVPTTLRRPEDPLILPAHLRAVRIAESIALTLHVAHAHGARLTTGAVLKHIHQVGALPETCRLARHFYTTSSTLDRLTTHARTLHDDGLHDLAATRAHLRDLTRVPGHALRPICSAARTLPDVHERAAAWVWLDATRGRPAGGPHPHMPAEDVLTFDRALNPDGRLHLRTWWQDYIDPHLVTTTATPAAVARRTRNSA